MDKKGKFQPHHRVSQIVPLNFNYTGMPSKPRSAKPFPLRDIIALRDKLKSA